MVSKRKALLSVTFLVWLLILPVALLGIGASCLFVSAKLGSHFEFNLTQGFLACSKLSSSFAAKSSQSLSQIPVFGVPYKAVFSFSQFTVDSTNLLKGAISIASTLSSSPTSSQIQSIFPLVDKFSRDAQVLFTSSTEISALKTVFPELDLASKAVKYLPLITTLSKHSDVVFGQSSKTSYLVLFQNNMELRPTGGFIGSFGLFDIKNMKLSGSKIYDVYDADGQLSGYIAPPKPIHDYLGEASWHMRDSNWDPDFKTSARRALWFLDKTINREAVSVIGVDLEVLKRLLKVTGPVSVSDFGDTIDESNFYQKIQGQVEDNFFPGSTRKKNYLTAVFNSVTSNLYNDKGKWAGVVKALLESFEARDIQIYFANDEIENALMNLNLGGVVGESDIGFVEANVGVNKANQFIERTGEVIISDGGESTLVQTLNFKNVATESTDKTRYKVYLRSFAPSVFIPQRVKVVSGGIEREVLPDTITLEKRTESGVYLEVKGGESASVTFRWSLKDDFNFDSLVFRKQSGVLSYPLAVTVSLTKEGETKYNTQVSKDINLINKF